MIEIGLTGGIASGKSTVSQWFREAGALVFDTDKVAHQLMLKGTEAFGEIVAHFGSEILNPQGEIDRAALGAIVFKTPEELQKLNAILHPRVRYFMQSQREDLQKKEALEQKAFLLVWEVPLLFETGLYQMLPHNILVTCSPETQIQRLISRNQFSRAEAETRLAAQWPLSKKEALAEMILHNEGDLKQTQKAFQTLISRFTWDPYLSKQH